jgi:hypothetical protein
MENIWLLLPWMMNISLLFLIGKLNLSLANHLLQLLMVRVLGLYFSAFNSIQLEISSLVQVSKK